MRDTKSVYIQKFFFNSGNQLSDEVQNVVEQTVFKIKKKSKGNTLIKKQEQSKHGPQQYLEVGTNAVKELESSADPSHPVTFTVCSLS